MISPYSLLSPSQTGSAEIRVKGLGVERLTKHFLWGMQELFAEYAPSPSETCTAKLLVSPLIT